MNAVDCCLDLCRLQGIACCCPCRTGVAICCWLPGRIFCAPDGSTPYPTSAEWKEYICRPLCSPLPKPTPLIVQPNEGKPTGIITVPPSRTPSLPIPPSNRVPIHGLIIGIDEYPSSPLYGAVYDAKDMEKFLKEDKSVPANQIRSLYNQDAKRSAIINAFLAIQNDPKIQNDDSIIIYYAGHGTRLNFQLGDAVEAIVPHDHSESDNVYVIPDVTIDWLLNGIARAKGDNIIAIFDCCHSGSITMHSLNVSLQPRNRYLPVDYHLPTNLDDDLRPKDVFAAKSAQPTLRGAFVASGYEFTGIRSHVLVAACGKYEVAKEVAKEVDDEFPTSTDEPTWQGAFTTAFLALLRRGDVDNLTYADIPRRIQPLERQNPQILGVNQHRFIFNSKEPPSVGTVYEVTPSKDEEYIMNGGIAHAISEGAEFTVYQDRTALLPGSQGSPLGVLRVDTAKNIKAFSTTFKLTLSPEAARANLPVLVAVQTKAGKSVDLYIHIEPTQTQLPIFQNLAMASASYNIIATATEEDAQLKLSMNQGDNRITIMLLDKKAVDHGLTLIPLTVGADVPSLHAILRRAAHFYRHLDSKANNMHIAANITVEFFRVDGDRDMPDVRPGGSWIANQGASLNQPDTTSSVGNNDESGYASGKYAPYIPLQDLLGVVAPVGTNLLQNGIVELLVDPEAKYAVKITNNTRWNLYPYGFVFDNSDFRIAPYFQSGGNRNPYVVDTPLPKEGGICTIGYGQGGGTPYNFCLPEGQNLDVSFIKFFFTTQPVDLSVVQQQPNIQVQPSPRIGTPVTRPVQNVGMYLITIVQRR